MPHPDTASDQRDERAGEIAATARDLLELWRRLQRGHLPVSFGCACGGSSHVHAQDFEEDVIGYLWSKHAGNAAALALLGRHAPIGHGGNSLAALLQHIADDPDGSDAGAKRQIVDALRRSLQSWSSALGSRAG